MRQQLSSEDERIEQLIRDDLSKLAERAGLKDARFGATDLIQEGILPGTHDEQVSLYRKLILNNIGSIEPKRWREALYVKLNLGEGYTDTSEARLGQLGRSWGFKVPDSGKEKGRSRRAEQIADQGRNYLANLIRKEIAWRSEHKTWNELQDATVGGPATTYHSSLNRDPDTAHEFAGPSPVPGVRGPSISEPLVVCDRPRYFERGEIDVNPRATRAEVASIPIASAVLETLEAARMSCEAADRKFVTKHLLLALFELPDSKVARCFDEARIGLAREQYESLRAYRAWAIERDNFGSYRKFDWDHRYEVWQAKELARQNDAIVVDELYLLLGILGNQRSRTRRELAEWLGEEDYAYLCRVALLMTGAEETPGRDEH